MLYQPEQLGISALEVYFQELDLLKYFPCGEVLTYHLSWKGEENDAPHVN